MSKTYLVSFDMKKERLEMVIQTIVNESLSIQIRFSAGVWYD
jgi:hypothetical protein